MVTFLTSAFWHGVAPGYYMAFIYGGFAQSNARSLRKSLRPRFFPPSAPVDAASQKPGKQQGGNKVYQWIYVALSVASVHLSLAFAALAFILLDVQATWKAWSALNFYGLWSIGGLTIAFRLGLGKVLSGSQHVSRERKKRDVAPRSATASAATSGDELFSYSTSVRPRPEGEEEQRRIGEKILKQEAEKEPGVQLLDVDMAERDLKEKIEQM
jgi:lysophospholipid acyltransferase